MNIPSIQLRFKNKEPNKQGELPLIIQIVYKGKAYTKGLGISLVPKLLKDGRIEGTDRLTVIRNKQISDTISGLQDKFIDAVKVGELTSDTIKNILAGESGHDITLLDLLKKIKEIYVGSLSKDTLVKYDVNIGKLNKFRPGIKAGEVTPELLIQYEGTLKGQKPTTTWGDLKNIRALFNKGIKHKFITNYPFNDYKAPAYRDPKREYIQLSEVKRIETWCDEPGGVKMLKTTAAWFILACYSGLRYSDLKQWDEAKMVKGNRLYFADVKTDTPHFVPIYPELRQAIERVSAYPAIFENQVCNRNLKEIMKLVEPEITVNLTMHMARHTFAVMFLDKGGTKDVLQKLLGHKKIATTEIYGKITDKRIDDEMEKVFGLG